MKSCIYRGQVSHRRFRPVRNDFRYDLSLLYLDLAELDAVFGGRWFWSARRPAPARFDRADHLGDPSLPLDEAVRRLVQERAGFRPSGPIRLLTHLRYFGYCFNPLSVYYCFRPGGEPGQEALEAVVLEVSNLPWRQMHAYVLSGGRPVANGGLRYEFGKDFHVSPFLPPDMQYRCTLAPPGPRLALALENRRAGSRSFDAHLRLAREPIGPGALARTLLTDPLATLRVTTLIHWQALKLWTRGAPVYDHPGPAAAGRARASPGNLP